MQTTGTSLVAVGLCSLVRMWTSAHGSRSVYMLLYFTAVQRRECTSSVWCSRSQAGNAGAMEPAGGRNSSDFYGLRLKPELFTILRHAGLDLLAYDGALCSEVALPLTEAALRIEADPALRSLFCLVIGCEDGTASEVTENLRQVAQKCGQRPAVTLRVRPLDDLPLSS